MRKPLCGSPFNKVTVLFPAASLKEFSEAAGKRTVTLLKRDSVTDAFL